MHGRNCGYGLVTSNAIESFANRRPRMNANEGLRRINLLGSRIMWYGGAIGFVLCLMAAITLSIARRGSMGLPELVVLLGFPLFVGGAIRLFAWMVEGFVLPDNPHRSETD
jgi:hypothetical protein